MSWVPGPIRRQSFEKRRSGRKMKKTILFLIVAVLAPICAAETFVNAPMLDVMCSRKEKAKPDGHTRACGLQCSESGFGIITAEGKFLKFDKSGNGKMTELLK